MLENDREYIIRDPEVIRHSQRLDRFLTMGRELSRGKSILWALPAQMDEEGRVEFVHTPRENILTALSHMCANEYKALVKKNEKQTADEIVQSHRERRL